MFEKIFTTVTVRKCKELKNTFVAHCLHFDLIGYGKSYESAIDDVIESCFGKWEDFQKYCYPEIPKGASSKYYKEIRYFPIHTIQEFNNGKIVINCKIIIVDELENARNENVNDYVNINDNV